MKKAALLLVVAVAGGLPSALIAQAKSYALESSQGLTLHNVGAVPAVLLDKKGVKVTLSDEAAQRLRALPADQQAPMEQLALIDGVDFGNGTIEAEIAGAPAPGAAAGARGFVGIAFRVQKDLRTYDAFYLRPTNGRADDQVRRNRSAQYVSQPDWPWFRLRKEFPSKYESYVDLVPGTWTKVKIEVRGEQARLYVHDMKQPTLIVNDVKSGVNGKGAVALWSDTGTVAHFRKLTVSKK
jgi:hypothetical protein